MTSLMSGMLPVAIAVAPVAAAPTHEQTVRGWIASGELKVSKFGTQIGYRVGDGRRLLPSPSAPLADSGDASGARRPRPAGGYPRCGVTASGN